MKKFNYILAAFAAIASFASCNKNNADVPETNVNNYTIYVEGNEWAEDAVKSSYAPGTGITIAGNEKMCLLSKDAFEDASYKSYVESGKYKNYVIKAHGDNCVYHIDSGVLPKVTNTDGSSRENDIWFPVIPYSQLMVRPNGALDKIALCAGPVQFPKADSFDPMKDFLVGKPFKFNGSETAEVKNWKRILAPVCVKVKGLPNTSIHVASMTLDVTNLAGYSALVMGEKPSDCYAIPETGRTASPTVTAVYEEPLAQNADGTWHVWFMVYPQDISGKTLTLDVSTNDKTYSRTVTLNDNIEFRNDKLNEITIDLSKPGTTVVKSLTQVLINQKFVKGEQSLIGSDGSFLNWTLTPDSGNGVASSLDNKSDILSGMRVNTGQSITLPYTAGVKKIRVYTHPLNPNNSSAMFLSLNGSTDDALRKRTNFGDGKSTVIGEGGFVTFDLSSLSSYSELVMKMVPENTSKTEKIVSSAFTFLY